MKILSPEVTSRLTFLVYRYRFLMMYILIGAGSLILELVVYREASRLGVTVPLPHVLGLATSIVFAYWMNVRFNFKVPTSKRNRAFIYFVVISLGSAAVNFLLNARLRQLGWSYEASRLVVAGAFFFVAYLFHRRFSFADFKKVGVAIYANGIEDIRGIHAKIGAFPDFIHVDIIDRTFGTPPADPQTYRLEVIRAYWPGKPVQVHIMSATPSTWIERIAPQVDTIVIHLEIEQNVAQTLALIRSLGKRAGLCLTMATPLERVKPLIDQIDTLMLLTIPEPGRSGQTFHGDALDRIRAVNQWPERRRFDLCVDGGINERNISLIDAESVVSGSSVLNHPQPARQIMRLQTSSSYERL